MSETIIYLIKVIAISAILYGYYLLAMRNRVSHTWNRFYLTGIFVVSLLTPLLQLPPVVSATSPFPSVNEVIMISEGMAVNAAADAVPTASSFSPEILVSCLYLAVSIYLLVSMAGSLLRMRKLWRAGDRWKLGNVSVINTTDKSAPFSFFHFVFWNSKIDPASETGSRIMLHEMTHVRQLHSVDRLLVNLVMIIAWINPVFWLIRRELFVVHEFLADERSVADHDGDAFARMLLTTAFPVHHHSITSHFFTSFIKRRLNMITKEQKKGFGYIGRFLTLPLALLILAGFSVSNTGTGVNVPVNSLPGGFAPDTVKASFPGGEKAKVRFLHKYFNDDRHYYDSVHTKPGTISMEFVVDATGELKDFVITESDLPYLSELIIQGLKAGPKWTPRTIEGNAVSSICRLSVTVTIDRWRVTGYEFS